MVIVFVVGRLVLQNGAENFDVQNIVDFHSSIEKEVDLDGIVYNNILTADIEVEDVFPKNYVRHEKVEEEVVLVQIIQVFVLKGIGIIQVKGR